jgi:hypothetical protein
MSQQSPTLYGGIIVPCYLRTGAGVSVKLRLIKISEIPDFLDVAIDEVKALDFCLESPKPLDFDDLTDESYLDLVAKNTELNFTRALELTDQRLKRVEKGGVELSQVAVKLASLLNRYSLKSPSPEVSPASKS